MHPFTDGETEDREWMHHTQVGELIRDRTGTSTWISNCSALMGHADNEPWEGRKKKAKATNPGWGGPPWLVSKPGHVSVYSTGPQGRASLPSKSWRVRCPLWPWPRLKDFLVFVICSSCSHSAGQPRWQCQH